MTYFDMTPRLLIILCLAVFRQYSNSRQACVSPRRVVTASRYVRLMARFCGLHFRESTLEPRQVDGAETKLSPILHTTRLDRSVVVRVRRNFHCFVSPSMEVVSNTDGYSARQNSAGTIRHTESLWRRSWFDETKLHTRDTADAGLFLADCVNTRRLCVGLSFPSRICRFGIINVAGITPMAMRGEWIDWHLKQPRESRRSD